MSRFLGRSKVDSRTCWIFRTALLVTVALSLSLAVGCSDDDDKGGGNLVNGENDAWSWCDYPGGNVFRPDGQVWAGSIDYNTMTMYYRNEGTYTTSGNKITWTIPGDEDCSEGCTTSYSVSGNKLTIHDDEYCKVTGLTFVYNPSRS